MLTPPPRVSLVIWMATYQLTGFLWATLKATSETPYSCAYIFLKFKFYFYYSACRLIGSRIIELAAYCYHILLVPLYLNSTQKTVGLFDHSVNVITFKLAQSDPIKRRILYFYILVIRRRVRENENDICTFCFQTL